MKGGAALEALAQTRTVIFDKTGTLTVGGARLIEIETAPGCSADEALRLAASVEQASQHVVAAAIVAAARERQLPIGAASDVREAMGSGVAGVVEGRRVRAGSHDFVFGFAARKRVVEANAAPRLASLGADGVRGRRRNARRRDSAGRRIAARGAAGDPVPAGFRRVADHHGHRRPRRNRGSHRRRARPRRGAFRAGPGRQGRSGRGRAGAATRP